MTLLNSNGMYRTKDLISITGAKFKASNPSDS